MVFRFGEGGVALGDVETRRIEGRKRLEERKTLRLSTLIHCTVDLLCQLDGGQACGRLERRS